MITLQCAVCGHEEEIDDDIFDDPAFEDDSGWWKDDNGDWICEDCWVECNCCQEKTLKENATWIDEEQDWVCESCKDDCYNYCEDCGNYFHDDSNNCPSELRLTDNYGHCYTKYVCEHCIRRYNADWDDASCVYRATLQTTNNQGEGMIRQEHFNPDFTSSWCEECDELGKQCTKCLRRLAKEQEADETNLWVYDTCYCRYHEGFHCNFKSMKYRFPHEKPYLYYGIELEVLFDSEVRTETIVEKFIKATNGLFVAESDSSVTNLGNGAEFISRPLSYAKWMSEEVHHLLEEGAKVLKKYNAYSPQPNGCGLHVHMSRRFFEVNTKKDIEEINADIDWIFQVFQGEIEKISRRPYTTYCASKAMRLRETFNAPYGVNIKGSINLEKSQITVSEGSGSTHHDAIIQTPKTFEIRTFKSTIDVNEILATIEFCRAVAHAARNKKLTKDTTFEDIIYCKDSQYLPVLVKKQKVDLEAKFKNKLEVKL